MGDLPVSRVLSGCISWPLGLAGLGVRWLARAVVTGAAAWVAAPFAPLAQLRGCAWHVKASGRGRVAVVVVAFAITTPRLPRVIL